MVQRWIFRNGAFSSHLDAFAKRAGSCGSRMEQNDPAGQHGDLQSRDKFVVARWEARHPPAGFTATLIRMGGQTQILIAGGVGIGNKTVPAAELFSPVTNTWTGDGSLIFGRSSHATTLLSNGRVLVTGGIGGPVKPTVIVASAEIR